MSSDAGRRGDASPALPRLGFAGLGWIGRMRMESLLESGAARVAALAEPDPELGRQAGALAPGARRVASFDELLELGRREELDGVVIATPSALHAEQTEAALVAGLHVFCQKPLGRTAAETRRVVEAARAADRLLGVDFCYRRVEAVRRVRDEVASGALGRIFAARLVFHNAYGPDKDWFYRRELSGGGCVVDLGIHLADLALWVLPERRVERVAGRCFAAGTPLEPPVGDGAPVEDYAVARLDLDDGSAVELACSWNLSAGCDAVIEASFWGTEGGATLRNVNGSFFDFEAEAYRRTERRTLASPPDAWGGRALVAWARRLAEAPRFDPEAQRSVAVAEVVDRMYGRRA